MKTKTASLSQLHTHPAQMRTQHDIEKLADLTLQLYQRGLDVWQPIVAAQNGDGYYLISGHRRRMARLLSLGLVEWLDGEEEDEELTAEKVRLFLAELIKRHGDLDKVMAELLSVYGCETISFVLFEGDEKAQVLALQGANFGGEEPDMMGIAHSFKTAVSANATLAEIARNSGTTIRYVENHLALTQIQKELAQRIVVGDFPISIATTLAQLPELKRNGLTQFILANPAGQLTAKGIKQCASSIKAWPGLQMPLIPAHQTQRNIARMLVRLWQQAVDTYPEETWAVAAALIYRHQHEEPWADGNKVKQWFQMLGDDLYFGDDEVNWETVVSSLLMEIDCQTCPVNQLSKELLQTDLGQGQTGVLGMPCRTGEYANRCIHGLAPNDPFDVRVPWDWSEHAGVVHEEGFYRVTSYDALLQAWEAQQTAEKPVAPAVAETATIITNNEELVAETDVFPLPQSSATSAQPITSTDVSKISSTETAVTPIRTPPENSPIYKQRQLIANYMQDHLTFAHTHPVATNCQSCRHKLSKSPTKDESVPFCAWASRLRQVAFHLWKPVNEDGKPIPVCRQFAPTDSWREIIPEHKQASEMPRSWVKEQILLLVKASTRHTIGGRQPFEFLTGRPFTSSENYDDWFSQQLDNQIGQLSEAQLWTLFVWALSEWQRNQREEKRFTLPANESGVIFGGVPRD